MGFSTSGATVILLIGLLVSLSMFSTATSDRFEEKQAASDDDIDAALAESNAEINVTSATYDAGADELTVTANNTGTVTLDVADTDVIVDNEYQSSFVSRTVNGSSDTGFWLPGEQLRVVVSASEQPDRVKVATDHGVAATGVV